FLLHGVHIAVVVGAAGPDGGANGAVQSGGLGGVELGDLSGSLIGVGDPLHLVALVDIIGDDVAVQGVLRLHYGDLAGDLVGGPLGLSSIHNLGSAGDGGSAGANGLDIAGLRDGGHVGVVAGPGHLLSSGVPGGPSQVHALALVDHQGGLIGLQLHAGGVDFALGEQVGAQVVGDEQGGGAAGGTAAQAFG